MLPRPPPVMPIKLLLSALSAILLRSLLRSSGIMLLGGLVLLGRESPMVPTLGVAGDNYQIAKLHVLLSPPFIALAGRVMDSVICSSVRFEMATGMKELGSVGVVCGCG